MLVLLALTTLVLLVYGTLDVLRTPPADVRVLAKPVWLAAVLLVPLAGPLAWLATGRPPRGRAPSPRHQGPDDDEDFLRGI